MNEMDFGEWVEFGASRGWVSLPVCDTHTGAPLMPEEEMDFEDGYDPCIVVMRVWSENVLAEYE